MTKSKIVATDRLAILAAFHDPGLAVFSEESQDWFEHEPHEDCDCYVGVLADWA